MHPKLRGLALAGCCLAAVPLLALLAGCQQPPPAAAPQPKRKSFEESGNWQPSAPAAAPAAAPAGAGGNTGTTPDSVRQGWQQVEQAKGDAARQQAAGEMLNRTQALADQPAAGSTPH